MTVRLRAPNGQERDVPEEQVQHFISKGATLADGGEGGDPFARPHAGYSGLAELPLEANPLSPADIIPLLLGGGIAGVNAKGIARLPGVAKGAAKGAGKTTARVAGAAGQAAGRRLLGERNFDALLRAILQGSRQGIQRAPFVERLGTGFSQ